MMGANPTFKKVSLKVAKNAANAATTRMVEGFRVRSVETVPCACCALVASLVIKLPRFLAALLHEASPIANNTKEAPACA